MADTAIADTLSREVGEILERVGTSAAHWEARLSQGRLLGRFMPAARERPRAVAVGPGVFRLVTLRGSPAS